jgi:electron transport complex protein RnfC
VRTITLEPDGEERWHAPLEAAADPLALPPEAIAARVAAAGVVGMGGATFPSAVKLGLGRRHQLSTLVINGSECEPYLTCDDRLMREQPAAVVEGARIMARALGVGQVLIAIEDNKPQALAAMGQAAQEFAGVEVVPLPQRYPMGSEKHLVKTLTGRETPARALTAELGVVVHNAATAFAVHEAVRHGRPLIERVVTISGGAIRRPANLRVPLGTPVQALLDHCGGFATEPARLIGGGPMMGQPLPETRVPVLKGSNGVLALTADEVGCAAPGPCLRCGSCVSACPCGLVPLALAARVRAGDLAGARDHGLSDCVGCGSCTYVCPSHQPLNQLFAHARGELAARDRARHPGVVGDVTGEIADLVGQKQHVVAAQLLREERHLGGGIAAHVRVEHPFLARADLQTELRGGPVQRRGEGGVLGVAAGDHHQIRPLPAHHELHQRIGQHGARGRGMQDVGPAVAIAEGAFRGGGVEQQRAAGLRKIGDRAQRFGRRIDQHQRARLQRRGGGGERVFAQWDGNLRQREALAQEPPRGHVVGKCDPRAGKPDIRGLRVEVGQHRRCLSLHTQIGHVDLDVGLQGHASGDCDDAAESRGANCMHGSPPVGQHASRLTEPRIKTNVLGRDRTSRPDRDESRISGIGERHVSRWRSGSPWLPPNRGGQHMTRARIPVALAALAVAATAAGMVYGHGDVAPQAVDTEALPDVGEEWLTENPYRADKVGEEVWAKAVAIGDSAYNQNCARCHGLEAISGGLAPDLRFLEAEEYGDEWFIERFRNGYTQNGITRMPAYEELLGQKAAWAIRTYVETRPDDTAVTAVEDELAAIRDKLDLGEVDNPDQVAYRLMEIADGIETLSGAPVADSVARRAAMALESNPDDHGRAAEILTVGLSAAN